jgi:hypothetical protein
MVSGHGRTARVRSRAVTTVNDVNGSPEPVEEDDWFGEGSAFDSGEELAAALLALARTPGANGERDVAAITGAQFATPTAVPLTWSVRKPGAVAIPTRQPGRSGWSIRNSVQLLHQAEEIIDRLRQEAVQATFDAAARAHRAAG